MESSNITSTKYICALCQNSNNFKHCLVWKAQPGTIHSLFKQIQRCEREHGSQRDKRERDEGDWVRCRVWGLAGLRRVCVCVCVCVWMQLRWLKQGLRDLIDLASYTDTWCSLAPKENLSLGGPSFIPFLLCRSISFLCSITLSLSA